jgi:hypothetical protein
MSDPIDMFSSVSNLTWLRKASQEMDAGKGNIHGLLSDEE